jgi:ataxin-3
LEDWEGNHGDIWMISLFIYLFELNSHVFRLSSENWIYHERQQSSLCGQHCLNNLLQQKYFSAPDLSEIALELDRTEARLGGKSLVSGNVSEDGFFSVQVLREALHKFHGLTLVSWTSEEGRDAVSDPTTQNAFVINAREHWYAIRKLNGHWWNLNSLEPQPQFISAFYLSALLGQLRADRCTIFLVVGNMVQNASKPSSDDEELSSWHRECDILPAGEKSNSNKPAIFSGAGRKLNDSAKDDLSSRTNSIMNNSDVSDDPDLALALQLSLEMSKNNGAVSAPVKSQKDIMREQRLKMLEKK